MHLWVYGMGFPHKKQPLLKENVENKLQQTPCKPKKKQKTGAQTVWKKKKYIIEAFQRSEVGGVQSENKGP